LDRFPVRSFLPFGGGDFAAERLYPSKFRFARLRKTIGGAFRGFRRIKVKLSTKNSLENFNKDVIGQAANFEKVEVEKIKYIKAPEEQLAKK